MEAKLAKEHHHCERCGHRTEIYGSNRAEAQRKLRWWQENRGLCLECARARDTAEAKAKAIELELPELSGTEKQIAYAETLRIAAVTAAFSIDDPDAPRTYGTAAELRELRDTDAMRFEAAIAEMISERSAHVWIENADGGVVSRVMQIMRRLATIRPAPEAVEQEAAVEFEATLRPATAVTETIAEFVVQANLVAIEFPEKHDEFRTAVKAFGFQWSERRRWEKAVRGNAIAIAAETARHLLAEGFVVKIMDNDARRAVETGEFEAEAGKRIDVDSKNKLRVDWRRIDGDYYAAAIKIKGAKWSKAKQTVLVPITSADELRDFAARAGFVLTSAAENACRQFDEFRAQGMVVAGAKRDQAEYEMDLSRPDADAGIDPDLADV